MILGPKILLWKYEYGVKKLETLSSFIHCTKTSFLYSLGAKKDVIDTSPLYWEGFLVCFEIWVYQYSKVKTKSGLASVRLGAVVRVDCSCSKFCLCIFSGDRDTFNDPKAYRPWHLLCETRLFVGSNPRLWPSNATYQGEHYGFQSLSILQNYFVIRHCNSILIS